MCLLFALPCVGFAPLGDPVQWSLGRDPVDADVLMLWIWMDAGDWKLLGIPGDE